MTTPAKRKRQKAVTVEHPTNHSPVGRAMAGTYERKRQKPRAGMNGMGPIMRDALTGDEWPGLHHWRIYIAAEDDRLAELLVGSSRRIAYRAFMAGYRAGKDAR